MSLYSLRPGKKPRIAWCSSTVFPVVYRHLGLSVVESCPWKFMLLEQAVADIDADWLVVSSGPRELECDFTHEGVRYVVLGQRKRLHRWSYNWDGYKDAGEIIRGWNPDLVHVHGSENYFGLLTARGIVSAPGLISLQGILGAYQAHAWGPLRKWTAGRIDGPITFLRASGLHGLARQWKLGALLEIEILRGNAWFGGRTAWDRSESTLIAPNANYRPLHELLRPAFAGVPWTVESADRHTIFFSNLTGPHKGGELLVTALEIVKREIPDICLKIGGSLNLQGGYARHLRRRIRRAGLESNVRFLGFLGAEEIARELRTARAFVSASLIDNSPNSVGEAMMLGVPCLCSRVGGLSSLGEQGTDLQFFFPDDPSSLASSILMVVNSDTMARQLSVGGRARAMAFHSPVMIRDELRSIYGEMLGSASAHQLDHGEIDVVRRAVSA